MPIKQRRVTRSGLVDEGAGSIVVFDAGAFTAVIAYSFSTVCDIDGSSDGTNFADFAAVTSIATEEFLVVNPCPNFVRLTTQGTGTPIIEGIREIA